MNYSSVKTNKGKSSVSYYWIDGRRYPCWIYDNGGYDAVAEDISKLICEGAHRHIIRAKYNISSSTVTSFINSNLSDNLIAMELANRKKINSDVKSKAFRGRPNPHKGKKYAEIYGDAIPNCGFKHGDQNPNFTRDKYIGCKITNKSGKKFRSSYEVIFSEMLEDNSIHYEYENQYKMCNGRVKVVDFVVKDILVEVTGYAYAAWKEDFDGKIQLLSASYPEKTIVIISTSNNIEELKSKHNSIATIFDINSQQDIINYFTDEMHMILTQ